MKNLFTAINAAERADFEKMLYDELLLKLFESNEAASKVKAVKVADNLLQSASKSNLVSDSLCLIHYENLL